MINEDTNKDIYNLLSTLEESENYKTYYESNNYKMKIVKNSDNIELRFTNLESRTKFGFLVTQDTISPINGPNSFSEEYITDNNRKERIFKILENCEIDDTTKKEDKFQLIYLKLDPTIIDNIPAMIIN